MDASDRAPEAALPLCFFLVWRAEALLVLLAVLIVPFGRAAYLCSVATGAHDDVWLRPVTPAGDGARDGSAASVAPPRTGARSPEAAV